MSDLHALNAHLNHWNDTSSIDKLKNSNKSPDYHVAEITNHLVDLGQRFTFAPNRDKLTYWSKDLVQSGIKEQQVKEVCQRIGRSFEKYPTLAQVFELLKSTKQESPDKKDPQTEKDHEECRKIKQIWIERVGLDLLPKMCQSYSKHVLGMNITAFESHNIESSFLEMLVLLDWKRSGFGKPEDIIKQGKISQEQFKK